MRNLYKFYDGFEVVADSPEAFVEAMKDSAIVFPSSKTAPEYMRGVAARLAVIQVGANGAGVPFKNGGSAWTTAIDATSVQTFITSLCAADLLTVTSLN
jgi:hypothetical protein